MVYVNGVKSSGRDHGTEPDDYTPMLASLPPASQNHHLDTKVRNPNPARAHDPFISAIPCVEFLSVQYNNFIDMF